MIRRSKRANKGQHSGRIIDEILHQDILSRNKDLVVEYQPTQAEEGDVKCRCGANKDNYDEETDQGGTMIECESCKTWQHAQCEGYVDDTDIPDHYRCSDCVDVYSDGDAEADAAAEAVAEAEAKAEESDDNMSDEAPVPPPKKRKVRPTKEIVAVATDKTRKAVTKAFFDAFKRFLVGSELPKDYTIEKLANEWAFDLEKEVHEWAGFSTAKKYTDKSRSLMVLVKKPAVIKRLLDKALSFHDMVSLSPEEIDEDLKKYAEKVRQESIRRSVLTVDDDSQRIRRTHKGEEVVESSNNNNEDVNVDIMTRNVDHRRFEAGREIIADKSSGYTMKKEESDSEDEGEGEKEEAAASDLDDGLDEILKEKVVKKDAKPLKLALKAAPVVPVRLESPKPSLPPVLGSSLWQGEIVFPDFASFQSTATYATASSHKPPTDLNGVITFNRNIKVLRDIFTKPSYFIEGRLDRGRADAYLDQVVSSRDLYLVRIDGLGLDYDKVFGYLLTKRKVGVLSHRPAFVKDAYLLPVSEPLPKYLATMREAPTAGLFALYVVKRDYSPSGRSQPPQSQQPQPTHQYNQQPTQAPALDSILSRLGGPTNSNGASATPQSTEELLQMLLKSVN